jgi:histidine triad (HIT) family protein
MHNHEPENYECPFCLMEASGADRSGTQRYIVRRTERAMAFVSNRWWPNNRGHVLVVPTAHHENLYDLPPADGHAVHDLVREMALAIRSTYDCAGVSTRQHNEPAGSQDVWHYHVHVFPRYDGDELYASRHLAEPATALEREPYERRLREYFARQPE